MMHVTVVQVGKTKDDFLAKGEAEFRKRLQAFCKLETLTVKEHEKSKNQSDSDMIEKESEGIIESIPDKHFVILLDQEGRQLTSLQLANIMKEKKDFGPGKVCFIIGGPYGVSEKVKRRANLVLSFSSLTFTHQMIRLLLLEQLYRAFTIMTGKRYHY